MLSQAGVGITRPATSDRPLSTSCHLALVAVTLGPFRIPPLGFYTKLYNGSLLLGIRMSGYFRHAMAFFLPSRAAASEITNGQFLAAQTQNRPIAFCSWSRHLHPPDVLSLPYRSTARVAAESKKEIRNSSCLARHSR